MIQFILFGCAPSKLVEETDPTLERGEVWRLEMNKVDEVWNSAGSLFKWRFRFVIVHCRNFAAIAAWRNNFSSCKSLFCRWRYSGLGMWGTTLFLLFVMFHVGGNKYNINNFSAKSFNGTEAFNLETGKFMILLIGTSFVFCTVLSYNSWCTCIWYSFAIFHK